MLFLLEKLVLIKKINKKFKYKSIKAFNKERNYLYKFLL